MARQLNGLLICVLVCVLSLSWASSSPDSEEAGLISVPDVNTDKSSLSERAANAPSKTCTGNNTIPLPNNLGCVTLATQLGDPCMISAQCQRLDAQAVCYNDTCTCDPINYVIGSQCGSSSSSFPVADYLDLDKRFSIRSPQNQKLASNGLIVHPVANSNNLPSVESAQVCLPKRKLGDQCCDNSQCQSSIWNSQCKPAAGGSSETSNGGNAYGQKTSLTSSSHRLSEVKDVLYSSSYGSHGANGSNRPPTYKYHGAGSGDGSYADKWGKHNNGNNDTDEEEEPYGSSENNTYGSPYSSSSPSSSSSASRPAYGGNSYGWSGGGYSSHSSTPSHTSSSSTASSAYGSNSDYGGYHASPHSSSSTVTSTTTSNTPAYGSGYKEKSSSPSYGDIIHSPQYRLFPFNRGTRNRHHHGKSARFHSLRHRSNVAHSHAHSQKPNLSGRASNNLLNVFQSVTGEFLRKIAFGDAGEGSARNVHAPNSNDYGNNYESNQQNGYGRNDGEYGSGNDGSYNVGSSITSTTTGSSAYGSQSSPASYGGGGSTSVSICGCAEGYVPNSSGTECVESQTTLGGSCSSSEQCGANQHCNSIGCCECEWPDYVYSDWVTSQQLHEACNSDNNYGYESSSNTGGYSSHQTSTPSSSYGSNSGDGGSVQQNDYSYYNSSGNLYGRIRVYGSSTPASTSAYVTSSASSAYGGTPSYGSVAHPSSPPISDKWSKCYPSAWYGEPCRWHTQCSARTTGAWCGRNGTCECPQAYVLVQGESKWQASCKPQKIEIAGYNNYVVFWARCCIGGGNNSTTNETETTQKLGTIPIVQTSRTPKDLHIVSVKPEDFSFGLGILEEIMLVGLTDYAETEPILLTVEIASKSNPYISLTVKLGIEPEPCCTEIPRQLRTSDRITLVHNTANTTNGSNCAGSDNTDENIGIAVNAANLVSFKKLFKNVCGNAVSVEVTDVDGEADDESTTCGSNVDFLTYQTATSLAAGQNVTCVYTLTATSCNGQSGEYTYTLIVVGGDGCNG